MIRNPFSIECKHSAGFSPVLWEKVSPTLTAVRAAGCLICGQIRAVNIPLQPAQTPEKNGVKPAANAT